MSIARKILWNTTAQILGKAVLAVIGVITVKIITNYLGVGGYGDYTTIYEFLALFAIASDLGLYTIAVREMAKDEKKIPMIVGNVLTIRTALTAFTVLLAVIASFFLAGENTDVVFPLAAAIAGIATVFAVLTGTVSTVLQIHLKMQYNSMTSVLGKLIALGYMLFIVFLWHPANIAEGFYQLLFAGVVGNIAMFVSTFYYSSKLVKIRYRFDREFIKEVVVKALPYGVALVLNALYFRLGSIMVYTIAGKEAAGIYGVPMRMLEVIAIVPLYFMNSVLPVLTRVFERKSEKYHQIIQYSFDFLLMAGLSVSAGTSVLAFPIVSMVSSEKFLSRMTDGYYGSDIVLQIVIFAMAFSFINTLFGFILVAINKQAKLLYINGIGAFIAVALNYLLIPFLGPRGAAITDVAVEFAVALAAYIFVRKYLQIKLKFMNAFKIILAAITMGAVLYFVREPAYRLFNLQNKSLFILIPLGVFIFFSVIAMSGVITKDMFELIKKPKQANARTTPPDTSGF